MQSINSPLVNQSAHGLKEDEERSSSSAALHPFISLSIRHFFCTFAASVSRHKVTLHKYEYNCTQQHVHTYSSAVANVVVVVVTYLPAQYQKQHVMCEREWRKRRSIVTSSNSWQCGRGGKRKIMLHTQSKHANCINDINGITSHSRLPALVAFSRTTPLCLLFKSV